MKIKTHILGILLATGLAVTPALAIPPALDHVSADIPVVIGISNLNEITDNLKHWAGVFAPPEAMGGFMMAQMMLGLPGVNADGSAAVAITLDPESMQGGMVAPEPQIVVIIPISSYSDFVDGLNGTASDGVDAINMMNSPAFVKDIGGGFAAISNDHDLVDTFAGQAGQTDALEARLGPIGSQAADENDIFAIVDVQTMRPFLDEGMQEMKQNMEMAAMMGGERVEAQMEIMMSAMNSVIEDGRTALIGFGIGDAGINLDFAGQFAPNSETGTIFAEYGDSSSLLGAVPNIDYIAAFGFDTSSPGLRTLMKSMANLNKGMGFGPNVGEMVEHTTGQAMVLGSTPGLFAGGLFTNTIQFTRTDDADAYFDNWVSTMHDLDGSVQNGMKFNTTVEENVDEVAGHSLGSWSMTFEADPNDDNAMAAGMATQQIAMIFGGEAGPKGYMAATKDGFYSTFARNKALMETTLTGEKGTISQNDGIIAVAAHLPENRTAEGYLNVKGLLDMVMPMVAMFGGPTIDDLPEDMQPIGMSLSTGDSGMHTRVFVPASVLDFAADMIEQFSDGGDFEEDDGDEPEPKPRF